MEGGGERMARKSVPEVFENLGVASFKGMLIEALREGGIMGVAEKFKVTPKTAKSWLKRFGIEKAEAYIDAKTGEVLAVCTNGRKGKGVGEDEEDDEAESEG